MNKLIIYPAFILALLLFNSCGKNKNPLFDGINCTGNCFILAGKILDSAVITGLSNAEIKFYFKDITGTIIRKNIYLGRAFTDPAGNYTFKFDGTSLKNTYGYYYAEAYNGNLFHDPFYGNRMPEFNLDSTLYNVPVIQNFSLFRPAYLKVRIIASMVTSSQSLTVSYHYGKVGHGVVVNGGRQIDTTITLKTAGDIRTFIQADIRDVGFSISKKDTILVNSNTTRQYEIKF
ncbi:MAG: hypothetical protein WKF85_13300 [Chitinophagaceae bacterium]